MCKLGVLGVYQAAFRARGVDPSGPCTELSGSCHSAAEQIRRELGRRATAVRQLKKLWSAAVLAVKAYAL